MYTLEPKGQIKLEMFRLPFSGKLDPENRWVKTAEIMPWDFIEDMYAESFKNKSAEGPKPIPARIAFGAIYLKEQEKLVDTSTLDYIAENPYVQYFLGLEEFTTKRLFDPTMMVHFRIRFPADVVEQVNEEIYRRQVLKQQPPEDEPPESSPDGENRSENASERNEEGCGNKGKLLLDATAAPADIRYPTDLSLLNECREDTEKIIAEVWERAGITGRRTQYNPKVARRGYLKVAKQRKPKMKKIKQAVREQLECVEKNLETLDQFSQEELNLYVPGKKVKQLEVIRIIAAQQREMVDTGNKSCNDRIVSVRQPHVRPIIRGKARAPVEFGQKLMFSVIDGYTFIDGQSWDNFNEGIMLEASAEKYKERFGFYPEAILVDQIYRNRENRAFCKKNGIRLSGPRLGRPKESEKEEDQALAYQDSCERNGVESRNGIAKRRYGLDLVMATLDGTAKTEAALNVLAMNIAHLLRVLLRLFWGKMSRGCFCHLGVG